MIHFGSSLETDWQLVLARPTHERPQRSGKGRLRKRRQGNRRWDEQRRWGGKRAEIICLSLEIFVVMLSATMAMGTPKTWTNNNGNNKWSDAKNWSPNGMPGSMDDANIVNSDGVARTVNFDATSSTIASLTVDLTGGLGINTNTLSISANSLSTLGDETIGVTGQGVKQFFGLADLPRN
jgi:hypothetical protein